MVYAQNRIKFTNKRNEPTISILDSIEDFQDNDAELKSPDKIEHLLYDYTDIKL